MIIYTYLGVTFTGLSSPYRRLPLLDFLVDMQKLVLLKESFQEPQTKLLLFDTFVTLTLLYKVKSQGQTSQGKKLDRFGEIFHINHFPYDKDECLNAL